MRGKNRKRLAFTLVELMVVVAILGILATVVALSVTGYLASAEKAKVKADMSALTNILEVYRVKMRVYPEQLEDLMSPPASDDGAWADAGGPFLRNIPNDPWDTPYKYNRISMDKYDLRSWGADRQEGGSDQGKDLTADELLFGSKEGVPALP
jgi:general secretion pathway protein G